MTDGLRFAVQTWGSDVRAIRRFAEAADSLGYDGLAYGDGLWGWTHDGWSMLGALAAWTRRIRLGPAVTYCFDPSSHHPSWLAKRAVTVDHLSGGRLELRLAVGAESGEAADFWRRHSIPYPSATDRVLMVEETVEILRRLWSGEPVDFDGRVFTLKGARLEPGPIQPAGPPVWVAAMSPRALRVTARLADGWEASYVTPAGLAERWRLVRAHLGAERRTLDALRCSVELDVVLAAGEGDVAPLREGFRRARGLGLDDPFLAVVLMGAPDAVARRLADYERAGATDLMLGFADFPDTVMLERFAAEVMPATRARVRAENPPMGESPKGGRS